MKVIYEITIDEKNIAENGGLYSATSADLLDFMALLLRREAAGGAVISKVGGGCGIPTGHTIVCLSIEP